MSEDRCPPPRFTALDIEEGTVSMLSSVSPDGMTLKMMEDMVRMIVNAAPSHERHVVDGHVHSDATETKSLNQ